MYPCARAHTHAQAHTRDSNRYARARDQAILVIAGKMVTKKLQVD
nr:MAG TPA: hypothetical protein [Bacteriophage sp.]